MSHKLNTLDKCKLKLLKHVSNYLHAQTPGSEFICVALTHALDTISVRHKKADVYSTAYLELREYVMDSINPHATYTKWYKTLTGLDSPAILHKQARIDWVKAMRKSIRTGKPVKEVKHDNR
jgi:hypothetical protein